MESSAGENRPSKKPFTVIAIIIFSFVSCLHLFRFFLGWEVIFNGIVVPVWFSIFGFIIATGLAVMLWREARK